jgi:aspartate kinase
MSRTDNRQQIVIKFGGTSLASVKRVRLAASRVAALQHAGFRATVVVSAGGNTTDRLVDRIAAVCGSAGSVSREHDRLLATGEDRSAALLALALADIGITARSLRGGEAGLRADGGFGAGVPRGLSGDAVRKLIHAGTVPVVAGFQAVRDDGETITLGRGGSDVTAVVLAAALGASCCHIVTDVAGVYDVDPRSSGNARRFSSLGWDELCEITDSGAVVVHPLAAARARQYRVPLRVYHFRSRRLFAAGTAVGAASAHRRSREVA